MKQVSFKMILLVALFAVFTGSVIAETGPAPGQRAPGFRLNDLGDNPVTLTKLRHKGHVLLVFWSTRCHVCHTLIPRFKQFDRKYKSRGVTLAAVNVGHENLPEVKKYTTKHGIKYLVLNSDHQKNYVIAAYQLRGTPTFKLVAPNGKILYHGHRLPDVSKYIKGS